MQERQEYILNSKSQIEHLIQDQKMDIDLLVLSIGSAHLTDTQQQCPNFCHEAAAQGKKVTVINFDPSFKDTATRLRAGQLSPDLSVYYSPLGYKDFENGYLGYTSKELEQLVIQFLTSKPKTQVVLAFHMYPSIPQAYKQLTLREDFLTLYKDRIFFIGSYYKDCSGFVYNQEYIAKYEIYERTAYEKRLLKEQKRDTVAYQNFNPNEQFVALKGSFSSAWNSLQKYTGEENEGCMGKTIKNDYGIDAYRDLAPQTDATLGYRFISLEYLSIQTVLQSDFNLTFLAQQRAQEIVHFQEKNTPVNEGTNGLTNFGTTQPNLTFFSPQQKTAPSLLDVLIEDDMEKLNEYMENEATPAIKKLLSNLIISLNILPDSREKQDIIRATHDLLIDKSYPPDEYVGNVHYYFVKAAKSSNCEYILEAHNPVGTVWDLAMEELNRRNAALSNLAPQ